MCISAVTASLIASGVGAVASIEQGRQQRKAVQSSMKAQAESEARAAQAGNAAAAARRAAMRRNSLATGAGMAESGIASGGRATLGGP